MTDDIRTRIATTMYGDGDDLSWSRAVQLADLIIWELGLRQEWAGTKPKRRSAIDHRYVTEWSTDQ